MTTASIQPQPIPRADVPVIDPKTGRMTPDWYRFFALLAQSFATVRTEV